MTSASPDASLSPATQPCGFEVATTSSDTLRASVVVSGSLSADTCPLLTSVVRTHLVAGRRYLRIDLAEAAIDDDAPIRSLIELHDAVAELGGMLVLDNAGPQVRSAMRDAALFVAPDA